MTNNFGGPGYGGPGYYEQRAYMRRVISRARFIRAGVFAGRRPRRDSFWLGYQTAQ